MEKIIRNIKKFVRTFPKKHHVEYVTGILTIPVFLSILTVNLINLNNNNNKTEEISPTQAPIIVEMSPDDEGELEAPLASTSPAVCKKEVGPIQISSPDEGETVTDDHVCINIVYEDEDYCSAVWSYRINGGTWSEYNNNSPCLYNLPEGAVKFELRAQSTVSQDTETLEKNFIYSPTNKEATPTAAQSSEGN